MGAMSDLHVQIQELAEKILCSDEVGEFIPTDLDYNRAHAMVVDLIAAWVQRTFIEPHIREAE
jgi:hypothetical protein